jgi:hypothetical protein
MNADTRKVLRYLNFTLCQAGEGSAIHLGVTVDNPDHGLMNCSWLSVCHCSGACMIRCRGSNVGGAVFIDHCNFCFNSPTTAVLVRISSHVTLGFSYFRDNGGKDIDFGGGQFIWSNCFFSGSLPSGSNDDGSNFGNAIFTTLAIEICAAQHCLPSGWNPSEIETLFQSSRFTPSESAEISRPLYFDPRRVMSRLCRLAFFLHTLR